MSDINKIIEDVEAKLAKATPGHPNRPTSLVGITAHAPALIVEVRRLLEIANQ